jgi:hypothetical protein
MEMPQGNSLCGYIKQTNMSFFKIGEQEDKTGFGWGRLAPAGRGEI